MLDILLPVPLLPDVVTQGNWPAALEYRVYVHMLRDNVNNLVRQHGGNEELREFYHRGAFLNGGPVLPWGASWRRWRQ